MHSVRSVTLVLAQFVLLGFLLFTTSFADISVIGIVIGCSSLVLGLWSILVMKRSKLSVLPDPVAGAALIKAGPYKIIRHPMYTSLIIFAVAALIITFSWARVLAGSALCVVLILKIYHEERLLRAAFSEYNDYARSTYRLIPFIY